MRPEPINSPRPHSRAAEDRQWWLVRRWPGLSGPNKLAWWYLAQLSNYGRELITVSATQIADDQGTSGETGHTRIDNLTKEGLILVRDRDKQRGRYLIEFVDPRAIARARKDDGQQCFSFYEEDDTLPITSDDSQATSGAGSLPACAPACDRSGFSLDTSEVPPPRGTSGGSSDQSEVPRTSILRLNSININSTSTSNLNTNKSSIRETPSLRETSRGSSPLPGQPVRRVDPNTGRTDSYANQSDPKPASNIFGDSIARLLQPKSPADELIEIEIQVSAWNKRIGDERMRKRPLYRLAEAVAHGKIKLLDVEDLFQNLARNRQSLRDRGVNPSQYINGGIKKLLART